MIAMAFSVCVLQPTSAKTKFGEARSRQTPAMRDWLKNNNPETKFRAESIKRRLKTTNPRYHAKFGLLQCQCNGTFKVCKKSNKGEDTCDDYHTWWGAACELKECCYCHLENFHFQPGETLSEHCAIFDKGTEAECSDVGGERMLVLAGAPVKKTHLLKNWKTIKLKFRVDRIDGSLTVGLFDLNGCELSHGKGIEAGKGSVITVNLWNYWAYDCGKGLLLTYEVNGEEVFRCDMYDVKTSEFQLCLRLKDAKVSLLEGPLDLKMSWN
jgi:hypothetical protein